ncbi:SusD-like starch-binding protein associating with outer membrane [Sphingobacterium yanglingense]|uniref:SusD-like starch-binding protein associating with outer membrane n=2 Tax=Sphingobacterium yanglingense TaxID=1437280 RepID=A0A4R6WNQ1_9SPHI|nr:SusD-like starch-binding protein associating with outer membrane [Sphingobacterium yanglingense]
MKMNSIIYVMVSVIIMLASCSKQDEFLAAKTSQSLAVPATLMEYYALLKQEELFNNNESAMGTLTADDDFYITTDIWKRALFTTERNAYIWKEDVYENEIRDISGWSDTYARIYVANAVLEGITAIKSDDIALFNEIKGTALFFRALAFYNLIQTFCIPYDVETAGRDAGIILRLSPDLERKDGRANLKESYDQVFADLDEALTLLPVQSSVVTRPSKAAVHALLARINLAIHRFEPAHDHAVAALKIGPALTDFNTLTPTISVISTKPLEECLFVTSLVGTTFTSRRNAIISDQLYGMYEVNDLRRSKYFNIETNSLRFRGTYDIRGQKFSGLAMDEIYLIAAECLARRGDTDEACSYLNQLLRKRYQTNTYVDFLSSDKEEVVSKILEERRKELVFRGIRYTDIKRYNKYDKKNIIIKRNIDGIEYILEPNSNRYVFPIPTIEIELNNIPQNLR